MGPRLHPIVLDAEQRTQVEAVVTQGRSPARAITRARILLKADCGPGGPGWTDTAIMAALDVSPGAQRLALHHGRCAYQTQAFVSHPGAGRPRAGS